MTMHNTRTPTIPEIKQFLAGTSSISFQPESRADTYAFIGRTLRESAYLKRRKPDKGLLRAYLGKLTGYRRTRLMELVRQFRRTGQLTPARYQRHTFPRTYTLADIELLARVDEAHETLSGPATRRILHREYQVFGQEEYERLSGISVSHLYNLRGTSRYRETARVFTKTRPAKVGIGDRKKPEPNGEPGHLRVDSVHQGDDPRYGKGLYHLNLVDEVTQWELVAAVAQISERYLLPALTEALTEFPFMIKGFHADNGSEFINQRVAGLLHKLHVTLTKSRPRRSTDNGLAETKNGAVIRKHLGYGHIPQYRAGLVSRFYADYLNPYLNYHRPCAFAKMGVDQRGKRRITYPPDDYRTPYEKLKSLPGAETYLKPGVTFATLDKAAYAESDTVFAEQMRQAKNKLFAKLKREPS